MKIINPPIFIPNEVYENELKKYAEQASQVRKLLAIFTVGKKTRALGISDADLICVVSDNYRGEDKQFLRTDYKKFNQDVFLHGPKIIPLRLFPELLYLVYFNDLCAVWKRDGSLREELVEQKRTPLYANLKLLQFTEHCIGCFNQDAASGEIDKRRRLSSLHCLEHIFELCRLSNLEIGNHEEAVVRKEQMVRNNWNQGVSCGDEDFLNLYRESNGVYISVLRKTIARSYELFGQPKLNTRRIVYQVAQKKIICSDQYRDLAINQRLVRVLGNIRIYSVLHAPIEYSAILECAGFQRGACQIIHGPYAETMRHYMEVIREHDQFVDQAGLFFSTRTLTSLPVREARRRLVQWFDHGYWFFNNLSRKAE